MFINMSALIDTFKQPINDSILLHKSLIHLSFLIVQKLFIFFFDSQVCDLFTLRAQCFINPLDSQLDPQPHQLICPFLITLYSLVYYHPKSTQNPAKEERAQLKNISKLINLRRRAEIINLRFSRVKVIQSSNLEQER